MRDLEKDQNKENEPARRSLEFGIPGGGGDVFSRIKPSESNVGIGKRARSSSPEFDGFESFENSIFFYKIREFFGLFYNLFKEKMFTNEIEDGREAP